MLPDGSTTPEPAIERVRENLAQAIIDGREEITVNVPTIETVLMSLTVTTQIFVSVIQKISETCEQDTVEEILSVIPREKN